MHVASMHTFVWKRVKWKKGYTRTQALGGWATRLKKDLVNIDSFLVEEANEILEYHTQLVQANEVLNHAELNFMLTKHNQLVLKM